MTAYIIDTETTDRDNPEVIELASIEFPCVPGLADHLPSDLVGAPWVERYQPSKQTSFGALAVHHILPHELEGCPPSSEAKVPPDCEYMIGHSIDYDWKALGSPDVKRICTCAMAQHVWPEADSYSRSALLYMLLGPTDETRQMLKDAHSALTDVENNVVLLRCILQAKPEIETWSALYEFSEDCRIPLKMPITKARGELLTAIDDGLLEWCLRQPWMRDEHPYLHKGLLRESERREQAYRDACEMDEDGIPF